METYSSAEVTTHGPQVTIGSGHSTVIQRHAPSLYGQLQTSKYVSQDSNKQPTIVIPETALENALATSNAQEKAALLEALGGEIRQQPFDGFQQLCQMARTFPIGETRGSFLKSLREQLDTHKVLRHIKDKLGNLLPIDGMYTSEEIKEIDQELADTENGELQTTTKIPTIPKTTDLSTLDTLPMPTIHIPH